MSDRWVDLDGVTRLQGTLEGPAGTVSSVFGRAGAVVAANGDYNGVVASALTGATAATRYVGGTTSAAPVAGTFAVGDFVIAQDGVVWVCTVAGTPGTWTQAGGGVLTLAAADASVVVGGTAANRTVRTGTLSAIATAQPPVAAVAMNGQKVTGVGLATVGTDAASLANSLSDFAVPSANVAWNSKKITGLANGAGAQDAAAFGQIPTALPPNGSAGGSLNGTYPNPGIANGAIADAQVAGGAAIAISKLAGYPSDATKFLNGNGAWTVPAGGSSMAYVCLLGQFTNNTAETALSSGSYVTRVLNTEQADSSNVCSLASNQFTLSAGTYVIRATVPAHQVNRHKAELYNATDSAVVIVGSSEFCNGNDTTRSHVVGQFTVAASKALEIRHQIEANGGVSQNGGVESNFGDVENYTVVELWKT